LHLDRSNITIWSWWLILTFRLITETGRSYSPVIMFLVEWIWFCYIGNTMIFCFLFNFRASVILMWSIHNICVSFSHTLILTLPLFGLEKLTVCNILWIRRHSLFWLRGVIRFLWDWLICLFFYRYFCSTSLIDFLWLLYRLRNLISWGILLDFALKCWLIGCLTSRCWNI
jgi:hypothetical protein